MNNPHISRVQFFLSQIFFMFLAVKIFSSGSNINIFHCIPSVSPLDADMEPNFTRPDIELLQSLDWSNLSLLASDPVTCL